MHSEPCHADTERPLSKKKPHLESRDKPAACSLIANEWKSAKMKVLFNKLSRTQMDIFAFFKQFFMRIWYLKIFEFET